MRDKERYLDLAKFRDRVATRGGREYWKSLDELCDDPEFDQMIRDEFPQQSLESSGLDRRNFLRLMGASLAFGGLTACTRPLRQVIPYVRKPEDVVPGKPLYYATAMTLGGVATGLLVESHMGRPTKVEGNPGHPESLGATNAFAQASVLSMYDPDRSQTVRNLGDITTWTAFLTALQPVLQKVRANGGAGFRILTETVTSPTLGSQFQTLLAKLPGAVWHQYEPASGDSAREGAKLAFGSYVSVIPHFDRADVVLSLDADFLTTGPGHLRATHDFMERRRVRTERRRMNRLYAIESTPSPTGAMADHRLALRPSLIEGFVRALAAKLGLGGTAPALGARENQWLEGLAADLTASKGKSIVIAGDSQPAAVHAIVHAINGALGNHGATITITDPVEVRPENQVESLRQLVAAMDAGTVEVLLILGGNPVFNAPADLKFAEKLEKVAMRAHLSLYYDETSARCHWHIPEAHYLESWGDARAFDGTVSIVQPLIETLYGGRTALEIVGMLNEDANDGYGMLRAYWKARTGRPDFESAWRKWLDDGVVDGTVLAPRSVTAAMPAAAEASPAASGMEIVFRPDPTIHDGRFANNGWLQELPKPLTKITWDNVALMSPATAAKLGISDEQVVTVTYRGASVKLPAWRQPGHADDCVTVHYGYGRSRGGNVADGTGYDVFPLRTSDAMSFGAGVEIAKNAERVRVASTQLHQALETKDYDRKDLVKSATIAEFASNPAMFRSEHGDVTGGPSFYNEWKYEGYAWGMVIDTNVCTGCGGCQIACQAENNIPVVGKEQVLIHREMHWIRIDHYYKGTPEDPQSVHQPVPCMHCENAPCEPVCPVEATTHSEEGINEMTYNRCVGTRYCANNCPYKVRRFNFLEFNDWETPSLKLMRNPDVTVRSRGVMEKCTYCVQRVNSARITAERDGRKIREGELVTACQASCPAQAILFGDLNDPESQVAKMRKQPHHYGLLVELNTQPRTTYLASFRNPNPEIEA